MQTDAPLDLFHNDFVEWTVEKFLFHYRQKNSLEPKFLIMLS